MALLLGLCYVSFILRDGRFDSKWVEVVACSTMSRYSLDVLDCVCFKTEFLLALGCPLGARS